MERQKKKQKGITLIALVISIIVMLILAGVSLNMTIGENGIISQAQEATYAQSIAMLEEYLQQEYVRNFDRFDEDDSKVVSLENIYPEYFYIPVNEGIGGLRYVVDSDGHALYLIKKSGLPDDIRKQLVGGDAGNGTYTDYQTLNDVYGVTSDLTVFYSQSSGSTLVGIASSDLDDDDPLREVFNRTGSGSSMYNLLSAYDTDSDGTITAEEVKSIRELTLNSNSGISSLKELYNLVSLQELTLEDLNLANLDGIENANQINYVNFKNCTVTNYSALSKVRNLKYLYFTGTTDNEIAKAVEAIKGTDYAKLQYLGVMNSGDGLTDLTCISNLTKVTDTVNYLYFYGNTNITDLSSLSIFTNTTEVKVGNCSKLENIDFVSTMTGIKSIYAYTCNLKDTEEKHVLDALAGKSALTKLSIQNNSKINYLTGIITSGGSFAAELKLQGCSNLLNSEVTAIADIYILSSSKNIDDKYKSLLTGSLIIDYANKELLDTSDEIKTMENMTQTAREKVKCIRIQGNPSLGNDKINAVLKKFPNVVAVNLNGCHNLTSLEFVKSMPNLRELLIKNTGVKTGTKDSAGNLNGLDLLVSYGKVDSIEINNSEYNENGITLNVITPILNRSYRDGSRTTYSYYGSGVTLLSNLTPQLSSCTGLTHLNLTRFSYSGTIDLHELNTTLDLDYADYDGYTIILPKKVNQIRYTRKDLCDFTYTESINSMVVETQTLAIMADCCYKLSQASNLTSINTFSRWYASNNYTDTTTYTPEGGTKMTLDFSQCLNMLKDKGVKAINMGIWNSNECYRSINLDTIDFSSGFGSLKTFSTTNQLFDNLDFLANCTALTKISCSSAKVTSIDALSGLTGLQELSLPSSSIKSLKAIENFKSLQTLNLKNNLLYDESSYKTVNDAGETVTVTYNNIDILVNLNKTGVLRKLYLDNNTGISQWSKLSSITNWTEHSGW